MDTIAPVLTEITTDWVVIAGLAEALKDEEKEEEEEEEEEESQSAEEENASETAKRKSHSSPSTPKSSSKRPSSISVSSIASSSTSSVPIPGFVNLVQGYPVDFQDPAAADNAVLAVAAAMLFEVMGSGGIGDGTVLSGNSTSLNTRTSITGRPTGSELKATTVANTDLPAQTTDGYSLNGFWVPGGSPKSEVTTPEVYAATSTTDRSTPSNPGVSSLVSPLLSSFVTSMASAITPLNVHGKGKPGTTMIGPTHSPHPGASPTSEKTPSAPAVSFPSQISSNQEGSSLCKHIGRTPCVDAYSLYNPFYLYKHYTSYVYTAGGFDGEWVGWGCAAMLTCDSGEAYAKGMTGQQILYAFQYLYEKDGVDVCGSIYMDNGCHLTVNACDGCESSIPCEALPEMYQPPDGGVPCFYANGTTWPPTPPKPPGNVCGGDLDKRYVC